MVVESAAWKAIFSLIFSTVAFGPVSHISDRQTGKSTWDWGAKKKAESELTQQINPLSSSMPQQYLFHGIHGDSSPEKITMLSDMLRYVLYDCELTISHYTRDDYI